MEISNRLKAVVDFIAFDSLADVGTDHGYVPIYAVEIGKITKAIACDMRPGPLSRAKANIHSRCLEAFIETRQGSGLSPIVPGEVKTAVIAGMGGILICDILTEGQALLSYLSQLVLQPQSDVPMVREKIHTLSWRIADERIVKEEGKYYNIFDCRPGCEAAYSERELLLGKTLIERRDYMLADYIINRVEKLMSIKNRILNNGGKTAEIRLNEIDRELELLRCEGNHYKCP